ncbi:MAG: major facilitator superfamily MFS1 [Bacteroidetes bacterium]|nr:MAG: major facilitator superfamily MFS1 [Bacteroidota bacterium]
MKKETLLLVTLAFIQFTHIMDFMIMMPLSNLFVDTFHITRAQFGLLVASYNISAGLVSFLSAFFIDRFDRKKVIVFCYAFFTLGTIACGFAPNYEFLLAARIFTGMFGGVLSAVILSVVGDSVPLERRASAMGVVMMGFSAAAILGVPLGNYAAVHFGWHVPFLALGVLAILVQFAVFAFIPKMSGHIEEAKKRNPLETIGAIFTNKNQLLALLLMCVLMGGHFSVIPYIPSFLVSNAHIEQEDITYMYLVGGLVSVVSLRLIGYCADRFGRFKVFAILSLCATAPLLLITHMGVTPLYIVLIFTSLFFIFSGGRIVPANTMITSTALPHQRGGFLSINSAVQQLAGGLVAWIAGNIITENPDKSISNYDLVGYIAVGATLLTIVIAAFIKPVTANGGKK